MNKRIFSLLCVLAVVLVFAFTAQTASISFNAGAEDTTASTTKKSAQEEPYVEPSTSATSATQPPMPTTSTTTQKPEESTTKPAESSTESTKPADPTQPTDKPPVSETQGTSASSSEPGSEKDTTKSPSNTTTTKKGGKTTTTKRSTYTTTKRSVPHMTIPQVDNTTIEGTTLSPLDAYFERISGDSFTFSPETVAEETQPQEPEEEHKQLSTIAIVAICLGGIALVTVALTAGFAIRNKHSDDTDDDASADYEQDAYGTNDYEQPATEAAQPARPQVDESNTFTVVSLDDKDYKD